MSAPNDLREDFEAGTLRRLATGVKDADQAPRLLALGAVYDGMGREDAARIGGYGSADASGLGASLQSTRRQRPDRR